MRKLMWAVPAVAALTAGSLFPAAHAGATAGRELPTVVREAVGAPDDLTAGTVHDKTAKCVSGIRTIVVSDKSTRCIRK